jgi:hypothetical protein
MQFRGLFPSTTASKWGLGRCQKRINLPCGHGRPSVHPDVGHAVQHHGARTTYYLQRRRLHRRRSATAATVLMLMVSSLSVEKMA